MLKLKCRNPMKAFSKLSVLTLSSRYLINYDIKCLQNQKDSQLTEPLVSHIYVTGQRNY